MGLGTVSSIGSTGTWGREAAGWGQRPLPRLQRKHSLEQRVPRDLQWGELAGRETLLQRAVVPFAEQRAEISQA